MKKYLNIAKGVFGDNKGVSYSLEMIVGISVVLVIATVLFLFRDSITKFIKQATGKVGEFEIE
mgnify:FL=1